MIDRRRFLKESLVATAGLSLLTDASTSSEARRQSASITFDLHTHPGPFFDRGRPEYMGDAAREYRRQLSLLQEMLAVTPAFLATRSSDLFRAQREQKVAAFLACEGGEFLDGDPERIDQLYADGGHGPRRGACVIRYRPGRRVADVSAAHPVAQHPEDR